MMDEEDHRRLYELAKIEYINDPDNQFWKGYIQALTTVLETENNKDSDLESVNCHRYSSKQ